MKENRRKGIFTAFRQWCRVQTIAAGNAALAGDYELKIGVVN